MIRALLGMLAIVALIAGGQTWRLTHARAELAQARSALATEKINSAYRIRQITLEASAADLDEALMEGGNEPLSDYLGDAAGRLWP